MKKMIVIVILAVALISYIHSAATKYATALKTKHVAQLELIR
jgi:hypothetical protein